MIRDILPNFAMLADRGAIPAKRGVCLLLDACQNPIQALAFANLREGVKRRLDETSENTPRKKTRLSGLAERVLYVLTDSPFESDWVLDQTLRAAFPGRVEELLKYPTPSFLELSLDLPSPKWKTTEAPQNPEKTLGPFPTLASANTLLDLLIDTRDLCRYPNILAQYPNGKACVYKEIGRCDAPCDGSVPMSSYLDQLAQTFDLPLNIPRWIALLKEPMALLAKQQKFEQAQRLKTAIETLEKGLSSDFKWIGIWQNWQIMTTQPGPDENTSSTFKITRDGVSRVVNGVPRHRGTATNPLELGFVMKHLFSKSADQFRFPD